MTELNRMMARPITKPKISSPVWRGRVVEAKADGTAWVLIPRMLGRNPVRVRTVVPNLAADTDVIILSVENSMDDLLIVSELAPGTTTAHTHPVADLNDSTALGRSLVTAASQAAARTALGITETPGATWADITGKPTTFPPSAHTHLAADISNSTTVGRNVLTAVDGPAARTAIGAGTSSLVVGTGATNAKAGNYAPSAADISDASTVGRDVLKALNEAAARTAIGAGTPTPSWADILGKPVAATGTVDGFMSAADKAKLDAATEAATANTIPLRNSGGRFNVGTPTVADNATTKAYVDTGLLAKLNVTPTVLGAGVDLNAISDGANHQGSNANASSGTNYPGLGNFACLILQWTSGGMTYQIAIEYNSGEMYTRSRYLTTWYPWRDVPNSDYVDDQITARADHYNPKNYGAVGNNSTVDQTAIVACLADALANNGTVYWPNGTYVSNANLVNLHKVKHAGSGAIRRGTDTFYPGGSIGQLNTIYVNANTGYSDTFDGITAANAFRTLTAALDVLDNQGPIIAADWTFKLAAGTYAERAIISGGTVARGIITIEGPVVNHPNVPTAVFTQGHNNGAVGIRIHETSCDVVVSNIKFIGYNGTTSSAGIGWATNTGQLFAINCHFDECYWGVSSQTSKHDVKGGIYYRCGFLGNTATGTAPGSRSGTGAGIRSLMQSRHSIGLQNAGNLTAGPFFYECQNAIFIQESSTGHVDFATIEDSNTAGVACNVNSRANIDGTSFKRNGRDVRGTGNSHFYVSANTQFGTGVDESDIKYSLMSGSTMTDDNRLFETGVAYGSDLKILKTEYPNQTISGASQNFHQTTLKGMVWRDIPNTTNLPKRVFVKVSGIISGTAGTKNIILKLGARSVSTTLPATATGAFEYTGTIYMRDFGLQYFTAKWETGTEKIMHLFSGTESLVSDTALDITAATANIGDSLTVYVVELGWA